MEQSIAQNGEKSYRYIRVPMALFQEERYHTLSAMAKLAYGLLLDRASLSRRNGSKWVDGQGNVFIYFPTKEMGEHLHCSRDKVRKIMNELEEHKLILRNRQGMGKPWRVVVPDGIWMPESTASGGLKKRHPDAVQNGISNIYRTNQYRVNQQRDRVMNMQRELDEDECRAIRRMLQEDEYGKTAP